MEETILTINAENIATILLIGAVGLAILRIVTVYTANKSA